MGVRTVSSEPVRLRPADPHGVAPLFLECVKAIAPEAALDTLDPELRLRDQFTFDSVDFLDLALALEKALGIRIPEEDYPHLSTLHGAVAYLSAMIEARRS
jgi:acyl carrier protein